MPTASSASRILAPLRSIFGPERVGVLCRDERWPMGAIALHFITSLLPALAVLASADATRFAAERIAQGSRPDLDVAQAMWGLALVSALMRMVALGGVTFIAFGVFIALNKRQPLGYHANASAVGMGPLIYLSIARALVVLIAPGAEWMGSLGHLVSADLSTFFGRALYAVDGIYVLTFVIAGRVMATATKSKGMAAYVSPGIVIFGLSIVAAVSAR